jgi:hypothetical protein
MTNATELHAKFGNVFSLDLFAPLEPVHKDLIESIRHKDAPGNKVVYRYYNAPSSWGIEGKHTKAVHVQLGSGSYFAPHRDYFNQLQPNFVRLNCFVNNTHPEETTYVVDGKIQYFKPGQWMCVNSSVVHYSFCFAENTVHYIVDIDISDANTLNWFLNKVSYCNRPVGVEGYK